MRLRRVHYNLFKITKFINTGRISVRVTKALMWHWVYWFFLRQPAKPVLGTMLGWYRYKENWLSSSKVFTCRIWLFTHHMFPMCVDMALGRRNAWIGEDRSKNAKQEPEALKSGIWELRKLWVFRDSWRSGHRENWPGCVLWGHTRKSFNKISTHSHWRIV